MTVVHGASPITVTGPVDTPTVGHAASGVTAGSYTNANIIVDADGHVTSAADGSPGGVTAVTATSPIVSSGGATPNLTHAASGVTPGAYTNASVMVDADGHVTAAVSGAAPVTAINVAAPITSTGGLTPTLGHAASGVAAATYTNATVTVDADGHVTSAASGASSTTTWTPLPAGGSLNLGAVTVNRAVRFDSTGATGTVTLPASGTAIDGQEMTFSCVGTSNNNGLVIAPGAGNAIADQQNPGHVLGVAAPTTIFDVGGLFRVKYDNSNHVWYALP